MLGNARLTGITLALLLLAGCADNDEAAPANGASNLPADAAELASADDGQWLSLTGTVVSAAPDGFVLDYGAGNVIVEMDDWDWYQEGRALKAGDRITVRGLADEDLFLRKRIEARSVYVHNLNSFFFASSDDEESRSVSSAMTANATNYADFTGVVTAIEGREFTLGTARMAIRVDTSSLGANPLDAEGFQQIRVGDRVLVWGDIDLEAAENAELKARGVISLVPNAASRSASIAGATSAPMANQAEPANEAQPANASAPVANESTVAPAN